MPLTVQYEGPEHWGVPLYDNQRAEENWQRHLELLERERTERVH